MEASTVACDDEDEVATGASPVLVGEEGRETLTTGSAYEEPEVAASTEAVGALAEVAEADGEVPVDVVALCE